MGAAFRWNWNPHAKKEQEFRGRDGRKDFAQAANVGVASSSGVGAESSIDDALRFNLSDTTEVRPKPHVENQVTAIPLADVGGNGRACMQDVGQQDDQA
eukprot:958652-Rhodomonas_salina.2